MSLLLKRVNLEVHLFPFTSHSVEMSFPGPHSCQEGLRNIAQLMCAARTLPCNEKMEYGRHCVLTLQGFSVCCLLPELHSTFSGVHVVPARGQTSYLSWVRYFMKEKGPSLTYLVKGDLTIYQVALSCLGLIDALGGLHWVVYHDVSDHI